MGELIARITEVRGINVRAELYELYPPYIIKNGQLHQSPRLNAYVKTNVGLDSVICQIKGEYFNEFYKKSEETEEPVISKKLGSSKTNYYLDLQVIGHISNKHFYQGLRVLPFVSAKVETLDINDYTYIFKESHEFDLKLGHDLFDAGRIIYADANMVIPSHIGIFGNTGSGKSNTLVTIFNEYIKKIPSDSKAAKVIVFDLNNEYSKNSIIEIDKKKNYSLTTRNDNGDKIKISFNDLTEDQMAVFLNASEKMQVPIIKRAYKMYKNIVSGTYTEKKIEDTIKSMIVNSHADLFKSLRFRLSDFVDNIDCFSHYPSGDFYCVIDGKKYNNYADEFKSALNNIKVNVPDINNCLALFEFCLIFTIVIDSERGTNAEFVIPLISRFDKLKKDFEKIFEFGLCNFIDEDVPLCIVFQLANVNSEMKEIVPSILSSIIFERQMQEKNTLDHNSKIFNIVIDEAHNLLYEDENGRIHTESIHLFEKIIKEGRKFATFLAIASQRPSDISNTIMSQIHNYFIHKLVNTNDIQKIRKCVAFLNEDSMNFMTILGPGECIFSGTAINVPTFVKVNINVINQPLSKNIVLFGEEGILKG